MTKELAWMPWRCQECQARLVSGLEHAIVFQDRIQRFCRRCWMGGIAKRLFQSLQAPQAAIDDES